MSNIKTHDMYKAYDMSEVTDMSFMFNNDDNSDWDVERLINEYSILNNRFSTNGSIKNNEFITGLNNFFIAICPCLNTSKYNIKYE